MVESAGADKPLSGEQAAAEQMSNDDKITDIILFMVRLLYIFYDFII